MAIFRRVKVIIKYLSFAGVVLLVVHIADWTNILSGSNEHRLPAAKERVFHHNEKPRECFRGRRKAKNIYFLKVHKCASTTIGTILTRHAVYNGLHLALPSAGLLDRYHIGWPAPLTPEHVFKYKDGRKINVMALHTVYNKSAVNEIMPRNTLKIAIIRYPLAQFWSAFDFFHIRDMSNVSGENAIMTYLQDPQRYAKPLTRFYGKKFLKNFLITEFGYPDRDVTDTETIRRFARNISRQFDLVMTCEDLYESLVLMRRLLCWTFNDILMTHLHKTENFQKHLAGSEILRELHKSWSSADYVFYEYFQTRLRDLLQKQDDNFFDEVAHLKHVVEKLETFCNRTERQRLGMKKYVIQKSRWNEKIVIRPADCSRLQEKIYDFHNTLIEKYVENTRSSIFSHWGF